MSQVADQEARPNIHYEWLEAIYNEVNTLNPDILAQAIINVKERGEFE